MEASKLLTTCQLKINFLEMKTMTVALLKAQFSSVIEGLRKGEGVTIEYGRNHQKLGVIIPFDQYKPKKRKVGIFERKASYRIVGDFKIDTDEMLGL